MYTRHPMLATPEDRRNWRSQMMDQMVCASLNLPPNKEVTNGHLEEFLCVNLRPLLRRLLVALDYPIPPEYNKLKIRLLQHVVLMAITRRIRQACESIGVKLPKHAFKGTPAKVSAHR